LAKIGLKAMAQDIKHILIIFAFGTLAFDPIDTTNFIDHFFAYFSQMIRD
jgi:hypothetical protein